MLRCLFRYLAIGIVVFGGVYASLLTPAFAQRSVARKIESIKKDIEIVGLEVPDHVINQIEDVYIRFEKVEAKEQLQMRKIIDDFRRGEGLHANLKNYHEGDDYYAVILQKNALYKEGRALLDPYIEKKQPDSRKANRKISSLTMEERVDLSVETTKRHYESEGVFIPESDLQTFREILIRRFPVSQQRKDLIFKGHAGKRSPELVQLDEQLNAFSKEQRLLLEPYFKKLRLKRNARRNLARTFSHTFQTSGQGGHKSRNLDVLKAKYLRHNIVISSEDIKAIENLQAENRELVIELNQLQASAKSLSPFIKRDQSSGETREDFIKRHMGNKKQREDIGKRREAVNTRIEDNMKLREDILRPYEEEFEAILMRR